MKYGYLFYNADYDRYGIKDLQTNEIVNSGLHCGDYVKVYDIRTDKYIPANAEYNNENKWYLTGTQYQGDLSNIKCIYEE